MMSCDRYKYFRFSPFFNKNAYFNSTFWFMLFASLDINEIMIFSFECNNDFRFELIELFFIYDIDLVFNYL
jgi:hypothetical protein